MARSPLASPARITLRSTSGQSPLSFKQESTGSNPVRSASRRSGVRILAWQAQSCWVAQSVERLR